MGLGLTDVRRARAVVTSFVNRPLSRSGRILSWLVAFVAVLALVGSIERGDLPLNPESSVPTFAVASGELNCMYPGNATHYAITAPLFPLVAGVLESPLGLGRAPVTNSRPCSNILGTETIWLRSSHAHRILELAGVFSWLALAAGALALLRTTRRRDTRMEAVLLIALALTPAVFIALTYEFHAEDFFCMGALFYCAAQVAHGRGWRAGIAGALAVLAQPFGILGVVALLVAPRQRVRIEMALAGAASGAVVMVPLVLLTSGRALSGALGGRFTPTRGNTWVSQFALTHSEVVALTRFTPIVLAFGGALLARYFFGDELASPIPLAALLALALSWRLPFEINIFGYYFMAVSAALVVVIALRGRGFVALAGWVALLAYTYPPSGFTQNYVILGRDGWGEPLVLGLLACAACAYFLATSRRTGPVIGRALH